MNKEKIKWEKKNITSFLKKKGFINQSSEIYEGSGKSWDLGANGVRLKKSIETAWWDFFINSNQYCVPCETSILTNEKVLEASGHKKNFHDWVVECTSEKQKIRIDSLLSKEEFEEFLSEVGNDTKSDKSVIKRKCLCGGSFSKPKQFNLMLKTNISSDPSEEKNVYLRPETCQGIFVNFPIIRNSTNKKIPFGIGQIGKSFRNEVTLNRGIFRMREFTQAEIQFFFKNVEKEKERWWEYWTRESFSFYKRLFYGEDQKQEIEMRIVDEKELPHYSLKTIDIYFNYHFGWGEVCSISNRGSYDLKNHSEKSSVFLGIKDENGEEFFPNVIEVSFGIERMMLSILEESYREDEKREYLKINPVLAPFFVSVMPLSNQLRGIAHSIYESLLKNSIFAVSYEETGGNIGKRYRRQDAIGTFFSVTIDFQTPKNYTVTLRERDSMEQTRILIKDLEQYLTEYYRKEKRNFVS